MLRLAVASVILFVSPISVPAAELLRVVLDDGEVLTGKLHLPDNEERIKAIVIFVHGTGPNTYENMRQIGSLKFKYYDMFGEEFTRHGIAFFTYNRRGVEISEQPPYFDKVDRQKYRRAVPSVEVKDLGKMIQTLRDHNRLASAKVVLLGSSEGTMIASLAAEDRSNDIAALLLVGYPNDSMFDVIKWQFSGASSMTNLLPPFDKDNSGSISKQEYESSDEVASVWRNKVLQGIEFEQLDVDEDQLLTKEDFRLRMEPHYQQVLSRIESKDEDWIWENYVRVSIPWLLEHRDLEPNGSRLLRLAIPIFVFHGEADANVSVEGVRQLESSFAQEGKTNLRAFVFKQHDHDLNFLQWVSGKTIPEGISKVFEVAKELQN